MAVDSAPVVVDSVEVAVDSVEVAVDSVDSVGVVAAAAAFAVFAARFLEDFLALAFDFLDGLMFNCDLSYMERERGTRYLCAELAPERGNGFLLLVQLLLRFPT